MGVRAGVAGSCTGKGLFAVLSMCTADVPVMATVAPGASCTAGRLFTLTEGVLLTLTLGVLTTATFLVCPALVSPATPATARVPMARSKVTIFSKTAHVRINILISPLAMRNLNSAFLRLRNLAWRQPWAHRKSRASGLCEPTGSDGGGAGLV